MNDKRLRRVRNELATLVHERRAERERNEPCPVCSRPLSESVRIIDPGEQPCRACEARAAEQGVKLVMFWPPRGIDEDGLEAA